MCPFVYKPCEENKNYKWRPLLTSIMCSGGGSENLQVNQGLETSRPINSLDSKGKQLMKEPQRLSWAELLDTSCVEFMYFSWLSKQ